MLATYCSQRCCHITLRLSQGAVFFTLVDHTPRMSYHKYLITCIIFGCKFDGHWVHIWISDSHGGYADYYKALKARKQIVRIFSSHVARLKDRASQGYFPLLGQH
jgi:hypothetical protein